MVMAVVLVLIVIALVGGLLFGLPMVCQSAGERRLVGSWELEPPPAAESAPAGAPTPPATPGPAGAQPNVQELMKKLGKNLESWARSMTPEVRVTFERDGTFSESTGVGGRRQVVRGQWEIVEGGDEQVVVEIFSPDESGRSRATQLTINFEGDDVMLYPGGAGQPLRMVRRAD
jgi:hypothetical protein